MSVTIILAEDVPHLGVIGDTVQVKPGYARNYLIPQGKAILSSNRLSKELQHHIQHLEKKRQGAIATAKAKSSAMQALTLEVLKKVGPGGRLFGSVTTQEIAQILANAGYPVDRRSVVVYEPIKTVGAHRFDVKLHTEVKTTLSIKVLADLAAKEEKPTTQEVETVDKDKKAVQEASPEPVPEE